jgi:Flp pilus assembly protein TadD
VREGMKRFSSVASILVALGSVTLAGCDSMPVHFDPLSVSGRDGTVGLSQPVPYATLMRLGAAAHANGDLPAAVTFYRRAAQLDVGAAAPLVAAGNTLLDMAQADEAIVAYGAALKRKPRDPEALRGLARAYLMTGKPELAGQPLRTAFQDTPNDPKLLELIGVADDFAAQHEEAQARYRRGLELAPNDPGLSLDLALSLALTGNYPAAIATLGPIAASPAATPRERLTMALIYGLQGDRTAAAQMAARDLDAAAVQHNLAFYETLRRLSPEARQYAIETLGVQHSGVTPNTTAVAAAK